MVADGWLLDESVPLRDVRPAPRPHAFPAPAEQSYIAESPPEPWTSEDINRRIEADIAFRRSLGFRSDRAFVELAYTDGARPNRDFGAAFSPAEIAEMVVRGELASDAHVATQWAEAQGLPFGGVYIDNARGGALVLRLCGAGHRFLGQPRGLRHPNRLVIEGCTLTMSHLSGTQALIERDWMLIKGLGVEIVHVGVDVVSNRVEIGVADLDRRQTAILEARYGSDVMVVPGTATRTTQGAEPGRFDDPEPHAAGIQILSPPPNLPKQGVCTLGFAVTLPDGNEGSLSAGHCGIPGDIWGNGPDYDTFGAIGLTVWRADNSVEDTMRLLDQYANGDVKPWVHTD